MVDEPNFPEDGPIHDAVESFRITWEAAGELETRQDESRYFLIEGYPANVRAEFSVVVPELDFSFTGEATSTFAFLGGEVNGYYHEQGQQPPEAARAMPSTTLSGAATMPDTGGGDLPDTGGFLSGLFGPR